MTTSTPDASISSIPPEISTTSITFKRGGTHPIFGVYVRGSALDKGYNLTSPHSYSSTYQLRTVKSLNMAEKSLYSQRGDTTSLKFNGKLDVAEGNTASLTKLNVEGFLRGVEAIVKRFGLEAFFIFQIRLDS